MPLRHMRHALALLFLLYLLLPAARAGERMDTMRRQGALVCGVAANDPGFALQQADGSVQGLEADLCRAVAAAVLGSASRVRFVLLDTVHEFLADPCIDIVFHRLSWTLTREAPGQLEFGPVYFLEAGPEGRLEPLAPLLRSDDGDFARAVRWVVQGLLEAELRGVDRASAQTAWPGAETGPALGLPPDWARRMVAQVGNYAEVYERNLGPTAPRSLPRGPNRLWRDGGLLVPLLVH